MYYGCFVILILQCAGPQTFQMDSMSSGPSNKNKKQNKINKPKQKNKQTNKTKTLILNNNNNNRYIFVKRKKHKQYLDALNKTEKGVHEITGSYTTCTRKTLLKRWVLRWLLNWATLGNCRMYSGSDLSDQGGLLIGIQDLFFAHFTTFACAFFSVIFSNCLTIGDASFDAKQI